MNLLFEKKLTGGWFRCYDAKPAWPHQHVHQVHSARVVHAHTPDLASCQADGLVSTGGETLAIKTADCLPVAVIGEKGVGLLHAGWRGLAQGILSAPEVIALAPREFFIGPCIHACCFEVTPEFQGHFPHAPLTRLADGTLRFDLIQEARRQLNTAFPSVEVSDSGDCTCCQQKYPSFRRDKTAQRIWNLLVPLAQ